MERLGGLLTVGAVVCVFAVSASAEVAIETVTVGNPGNAGELSGDASNSRVCGAVNYTYDIGKYEVTAGQYAAFLDAVAATDRYGLYNTGMSTDSRGCQIKRSGSSGNYTYTIAPDWADRPVNYVSFWDSCRFANWLHNGQPVGAQGAGTTETGAYTLDGHTGQGGGELQRNADWQWAVTSEDEWYKAAYHRNDGVTGNYFDYPTSSDTAPSNLVINPDPGNSANYYIYSNTIGSPYWRTEVGEFENSGSPYGTFDQGGNVSEWNEAIILSGIGLPDRGARGVSFHEEDSWWGASMHATFRGRSSPADEANSLGFRVSRVPEPASIFLVALAALGIIRRR